MIEARARVLRVDGEQAWLCIDEQAGGCGRCDEPGGCRSVKISTLFRSPQQTFRVRNEIGAQPGDAVRVCMEDGAPLRAALVSYGLGALLAVLGAALGSALVGGDPATLAGALGGLLAALGLNRMLARSRRWRGGLRMSVLPAGACAHRHDEAVR
ncbi:Fis family transcriptional regulator [Pseudothauera nasutitermitis]|uniref:Fis family transcriptional regulator n=1 Tax=Pseudothauera nasutitermitis TaxID=2565930 RepID=A0A4S4B3D1_9RHOO|nr:SoxR reducing system RseC family protein [Pseudothauera nasutitermitis]THF67177.1 Fis family transcriptional regulator [Pseudothauera nasutitermitis]